MGYQIPVFKEYVNRFRSEVHVVHWNHIKLTPYQPPSIENVFYYKRSDYKTKGLKKLMKSIQPDIIYISGWMDNGYLAAVRFFRRSGVPVIAGFDDIWEKTIRQKLACLFSVIIRKLYFSHAWVAGPYQFEYAKRLGFKNHQIIYNCLSADTELFNSVYQKNLGNKQKAFPHKFLFTGRISHEKGIDTLLKAWSELKEERKTRNWELTLIGNGPMATGVAGHSDCELIDFMQPIKLAEKCSDYGCLILPSLKEPWALVIHEFAAAGFPLICSDVCGAAPMFVTHGYNGYIFKNGEIPSLKQMMLRIINSSDSELVIMAENSHCIGQRITPEITAASFISILR
jgi:glycosyltransferase involved in cell wall biosynthesis